MDSAAWASECPSMTTSKTALRKPSKPLEGTPLLRRPVLAGLWVERQCKLMLCLPVVCFLDYTHSPRQARVLGELTRCFKSGLSLPFSFQILLVPPYVLQSSSNGHLPFAKSTPPLITQWQSSGVHSASNPCLSCGPGGFHTALRLLNLQGLLWSKSNRINLPSSSDL